MYQRNPRRKANRMSKMARLRTTRVLAGEMLESRSLMAGLIGISPPYVEKVDGTDPKIETPPQPPTLQTFPLNQTFLLNSRPSATKTIYLDFDGHTTSGTLWNSQYNNNQPFTLTAYDTDGNGNAFSNSELLNIQNIFLQVAEDFSPFDVNVTTQEPPVSDLINSGGSDVRWGVRTIIGSTFAPFSSAGGVAWLTSFNWNTDTPALVFENNLGNGNPKFVAEATSHEVGHTLGLNHDGRTTPSEEYYGGHGTGATGWAPIMGVGYSRQLVQWSRGQYLNPSNTEDDLNIITTNNGFGYRVDDFGNSMIQALPLAGSGTSTFTVSQAGVIERNTDQDLFRINAAAGQINLAINGAPISPNLDIQVQLLNDQGTVLATSNPSNALNATINYTATAGTYYLRIDGVGLGDPLATGYTDYGSIGQYFISGTFLSQQPNAAPVINDQRLANLEENASNGTSVGTVTATDPDVGQTLSYAITGGNTGGAFAINSVTGAITVANTTAINFETNPVFTLTVQVTDSGAPALSDTGLVTIRLENLFEVTPSAVQMLVPLYQYPLSAPATLSPWWQKVIDDASPTTPMTVIINPNNGPINPAVGGADYNNYLFGLSRLRENPNVRILGYIPTGYGTLSGAAILGRLAWYEAGYKHDVTGASLLDGIFLDEMSSNISHVPLYQTVATGIRLSSELANTYIAANPGTTIPVQFVDAGTADLYVVREGTLSLLQGSALPSYVTDLAYAGTEFAAIVHSATLNDQIAAMREFKLRGLDFGFVTDDVIPNPFDATPTHWDAQVESIHAPAMNGGAFTIPENLPNGIVIGTVAAVEPDGQPVTYTIVGGNTGGAFAIDANTGEISVVNSAALDFETISSFSLQVRATDNESPALSDTNLIEITLLDASEATYSFVAGVLTVIGTPENDDIQVYEDLGVIRISDAGVVVDTGIALASVTRIDLFGGDGHDRLGNTGVVRPTNVYGEGGDDWLLAGPGNDNLVGGLGNDTVGFELATSPVTLSLASTAVQNTGGSGLDKVTTIENVFGSNFNDTLTGSALANVIDGSLGDDILAGGAGNDTYLFNADIGFGSDTVSDASGIDTIQLGASTQGVVFHLGLTTPQSVGAGTVTLTSANAFEIVEGGVGDDTLTGNTAANTLRGGNGNDLLQGGNGNDTYEFDTDSFLGSDTIVDNVGVDVVSFAPSTIGVSFDLSLLSAQVVNTNLTLTLDPSTLIDNLIGGAGDDQLFGNNLVNTLIGNAGNDELNGGFGNDTYMMDADVPLGTDTLSDVMGVDVLNFSLTTTQAINVSLEELAMQVVNSNLSLILFSATMFETLVGGSLGDHLIGNSLNNSITGGLGNDILEGRGGVDMMIGSAGNDQLLGGLGNDTYQFDADANIGSDSIVDDGGVDQISYSLTTTQVVSLNLGTAGAQVVNPFHSLTLSVLGQIEGIVGGSLGDTLVGDGLANTLTGGPGNDTLDGGAGVDLIIGGAGDDALQGGLGDDRFQFDADTALGVDSVSDVGGLDTLDFGLTTTLGVTVDLAAVGVQAVNANLGLNLLGASEIDSVIGTRLSDSLSGNSGNNLLLGGLGDDTLDGRSGRDVLIGGTGLDVLLGGADDDLLIGGTSIYESSLNNLNVIMGEWGSANSYAVRVANLQSGLLGVALIAKNTVKKDVGADTLTGDLGEDWFFRAVEDVITDLAVGESVDAL